MSVTRVPVSVTRVPVSVTRVPVSVTRVPVSVTHVPVSVTRVPVSVTRVPVSVTHVPVSVTRVPVSVTHVPVSVTRVPVALADGCHFHSKALNFVTKRRFYASTALFAAKLWFADKPHQLLAAPPPSAHVGKDQRQSREDLFSINGEA